VIGTGAVTDEREALIGLALVLLISGAIIFSVYRQKKKSMLYRFNPFVKQDCYPVQNSRSSHKKFGHSLSLKANPQFYPEKWGMS